MAEQIENHVYKHGKNYQHLRENNWYGIGGQINFGVGVFATGVENFSGISRIGTNFKLYTATITGRVFYANQYVSTFSVAKTGNLLGKASLGAGVIMDGFGVYNYYYGDSNSPNSVHPAKMGLNTTIGAYGVWVNPALSIMYFGVDAFYPGGWPAAVQQQSSLIQQNQSVLGSDWNLYRDY